MKSATRIAASALGMYAGLLAVEHGIFGIQQGNVAPDGLLINAMGPPCQADTVWHACYPALTVVPNFFVTGVLAIVAGVTGTQIGAPSTRWPGGPGRLPGIGAGAVHGRHRCQRRDVGVLFRENAMSWGQVRSARRVLEEGS